MNKIISLCISFCIMILSFASIYVESSDYQYQTYVRINPITKEEEIIDARDFSDYDELMEQMATDYFNIYNINDEVVGWLNIPNVGYYPVTMNEDNQYYLSHNEYKEYSKAGIPFMNNSCGGTFEDIALIHGHHMKNGSMFGSLDKYRDEEFFQNNDLITVFDGKYLYIYQPFTVVIYKEGSDTVKTTKMNEIDRREYLESLMEQSIVSMKDDVKINLNNQILFLSTCNYSFQNARLLVGCVMVDKIKY